MNIKTLLYSSSDLKYTSYKIYTGGTIEGTEQITALLTSNHFVQITGAGQDKKGGFVNYWSWGNSTEYTSRTGGQSGVFSLMVF